MKLAIFGGSFDPPHLAHYSLIKNALLKLQIDRLLLIPNYVSPLKSKGTEAKQKIIMMELFLKEIKKRKIEGFWKVGLECFEINRANPSYTYDTLVYLYKKYTLNTKPYLILGQDSLCSFKKWYKYKEILSLVELVYAKRRMTEICNFDKFKCEVLDMEKLNISSSMIRKRIFNRAKGSEKYLFDSVYKYIIENEIYLNG